MSERKLTEGTAVRDQVRVRVNMESLVEGSCRRFPYEWLLDFEGASDRDLHALSVVIGPSNPKLNIKPSP